MDELEKFLKEIVKESKGDTGDSEIDKHISLAREAQSLLGGDLKEYLRMYDRELQDAISSAKRKKTRK